MRSMRPPSSFALTAASLAIVTWLALALAAPAARADLVVDGRGWGHGIGLSQYGAYGYALLEGRDHEWILGHYYPGTALARGGAGSMRVLLKRTRAPRLCGATRLRDAASRSIRLRDDRSYRFAISGARVHVTDTRSGRRRARVTAPLTVSGGDTWCLRGRRYRGRARLIRDGRALLVVNSVGLESYLRGVVAAEMPASWPPEALAAQAVIARSYALRGRRPATSPYDVFADVRSQVYGGVGSETTSTDAAVRATRRKVVTAGGLVAQTFFFSTSGGRTAANEEVWGGAPISYLRSVDDPHDDLSPYHRWTATFTDRQAARKLRPLGAGSVESVRVASRTASGRAARVELRGADTTVTVSAARIQFLLGLRSTWFSVARSPGA
jgi:stage II sporulation protein D